MRRAKTIFVGFSLLITLTFAVAEEPQLGSSRVVFQACRSLVGSLAQVVDSACLGSASLRAQIHKPRAQLRQPNKLGLPRAIREPDLERQKTNYGDIEFGFFSSVAPKTVEHIFKLVRLGCYNTNHFFRVDKGFVAQVADVVGGRTAPMNAEQRKEAEKTVIGEFSKVKHVRGILSMGRYDDPDSASSSFSILLGDAPHLDGQYAIFGKVTKGDETLRKLEEVPTRKEGIFVMPVERITILSSYYYDINGDSCEEERSLLKRRLAASYVETERWRMKCFP